MDFTHQYLGFESVNLFMEIRGDTPFEVLGFSDIDDRAVSVPELVAARLLRHVGDDVFEFFGE